MSRRMKRLLRKLRDGKADPNSLFTIRINAAPMLSAEELAVQNDPFPADEVRQGDWSAEPISGAKAIRAKLDSFHLVGRRIWNVWTTSHDYQNIRERLEDAVYADLKNRVGLSEADARSGSSIYAHARRARIPRCMETDMPFVLEFDSRETFEIDVEIAPTYRMSMNHIPLRLLCGKHDNIDPSAIFSPVLGRTIVAVELETIAEEDEENESGDSSIVSMSIFLIVPVAPGLLQSNPSVLGFSTMKTCTLTAARDSRQRKAFYSLTGKGGNVLDSFRWKSLL